MHHTSTVEVPPLKDLSAIAAEHNPDKVAFGEGLSGRTLTWDEFDRESNRAATALQESIGTGDRVAFLCENGLDHTVLLNGALKAGAVVSNLHMRAAPNTVAHMIDTIRPRVLVIDDATATKYHNRVADKLTTDVDVVVRLGEGSAGGAVPFADVIADGEASAPDVRATEDDVAVVMWTSGTTGEPKGWCFTNRSLYLRGLVLTDVLEVNRSTRQPHVFTPSFAAWWSVVLPAMLSGATTYFIQEWNPSEYLRLIEERQLTTALLVPTMWREMLDDPTLEATDLSSLKALTSAGEVLDATTVERLREAVCPVVKNSYAATEAYATVMTNDELVEGRIESVGKPVPGVQMRVIDQGGSYTDTKPPGEVGELAVRAPDCPVWAWGRTEKTEATFEDGWWYSGDLGYRDEDGFFYLQGRTDFMIKTKGIKVYPSTIEERLNAHDDVIESAVIGVEDDEFGQKVTAYVHTDSDDLTAEELDEWCLESDDIARFERPREYHLSDDRLPRTATGKLDRMELED